LPSGRRRPRPAPFPDSIIPGSSGAR
jgi:hypothetical protein